MRKYVLVLVTLSLWLPIMCSKKENRTTHVYEATLNIDPDISYEDISNRLKSILSEYPEAAYFKSKSSTEKSIYIQILTPMLNTQDQLEELNEDEEYWIVTASRSRPFATQKAADKYIKKITKKEKLSEPNSYKSKSCVCI